MELKEGMYVRTPDGRIFKFLKINNGNYIRTFISDNETITTEFELNDVLKASYKIIDLIEVGDYVNGWKIHWVDIKNQRLQVYDIKSGETLRMINKGSIKSIVTKEQFESMSYKLGD